jgi:probable HAF family extracellular repeat protein
LRIPSAFLIIGAGIALPLSGACARQPQSCVIPQYSVVTLPLKPAAINEKGEVAGTTPEHRAATWSAGAGLREIPLPAGFAHSEATSINARGAVVGIAYDPGFTTRRGFLFADGSFSWLQGGESRGYRINASGAIAGESIPPDTQCSGPVLWTRNRARALGGCRGAAVSLNDVGQVIGDSYDDQSRYHAFLWTARDGMRQIGPEAPFSSALAINALGHVVIQAYPSVFLYAHGGSTQLRLSPRHPSQPRAINDCDIVVGSFGPNSDANHAFAWDRKSGFRDLNKLLSDDTSGWKLAAASDINDLGEIVGTGEKGTLRDVGFLLMPVESSRAPFGRFLPRTPDSAR